jgi:hypothetical protein
VPAVKKGGGRAAPGCTGDVVRLAVLVAAVAQAMWLRCGRRAGAPHAARLQTSVSSLIQDWSGEARRVREAAGRTPCGICLP